MELKLTGITLNPYNLPLSNGHRDAQITTLTQRSRPTISLIELGVPVVNLTYEYHTCFDN